MSVFRIELSCTSTCHASLRSCSSTHAVTPAIAVRTTWTVLPASTIFTEHHVVARERGTAIRQEELFIGKGYNGKNFRMPGRFILAELKPAQTQTGSKVLLQFSCLYKSCINSMLHIEDQKQFIRGTPVALYRAAAKALYKSNSLVRCVVLPVHQ